MKATVAQTQTLRECGKEHQKMNIKASETTTSHPKHSNYLGKLIIIFHVNRDLTTKRNGEFNFPFPFPAI